MKTYISLIVALATTQLVGCIAEPESYEETEASAETTDQHVEPTPPDGSQAGPMLAEFEGQVIDLSEAQDDGHACLVLEDKTECFRSAAEADARRAELDEALENNRQMSPDGKSYALPASGESPGGNVVDYELIFNGERTISLPNKSDLTINVITRVMRNNWGEVFAHIRVGWEVANWPPVGSGHKFDGFKVQVRLERRSSSGGSDTVIKSYTCDLTSALNQSWAGFVNCYSQVAGWNTAYYWSGDGYVQWDVDNDGKSWLPAWDLHGTPLMS